MSHSWSRIAPTEVAGWLIRGLLLRALDSYPEQNRHPAAKNAGTGICDRIQSLSDEERPEYWAADAVAKRPLSCKHGFRFEEERLS